MEARYKAYWIPGLDSALDQDAGLDLGQEWLNSRSGFTPSQRIVVLNALYMAPHFQLRGPTYSPQSKTHPSEGPRAVLAVYPAPETLEFAESLALRGQLCVIPGSVGTATQWIARTGAECLVEETTAPTLRDIPPEAKEIIDQALLFGGHNGFAGGYEKDRLIGDLREVRKLWAAATAADIEAYMLSTGETNHKGAARAREWYQGIIDGKRFRGERGRLI